MKYSFSSLVFAGLLLVTFSPSVAAYTFENPLVRPLYGPDFRPTPAGARAVTAPMNDNDYYGIPERGVQRLRVTDREQLLADLEQRVISLQKLRGKQGITPKYDAAQRIYERVLRRVGDDKVQEHYRTKKQTGYRELWRNGKLVKVPRLSPADIHSIVDTYEEIRAVRTSPKDECARFSGTRAATCRYQQRVSDRIQN